MSTNSELKVLHDRLLSDMPEGAQHDACALCAMETADHHDGNSGGPMPESFTQEELDAAIAAASGSLQQRLAELEAQVQETEVGRAVAEATTAKDTEISGLQQRLDSAEAARTAAEAKLGEVEQFWTTAISQQEAAVAFAACRDERMAKAKEAVVFSDEYLAENADRFAAMSEDDFAARLEEWRLIATKSPKTTTSIPAKTALVAARAEGETGGNKSALSNIGLLRRQRVDPRVLGGAQ